MNKVMATIVMVAMIAMISACGTKTGAVTADVVQYQDVETVYAPQIYEMNATRFRFTPDHLIINEGDQIIFTNWGADDIKIQEAGYAMFESPFLQPKNFYQHTFSKEGVYEIIVQRNQAGGSRRKSDVPDAHATIEVRRR